MTSDVWTIRRVMTGAVPWTVSIEDTTARRGSSIWGVKKAVEEGRMPPVLILHGNDDPRVPVGQARAFQKACEALGVEHEMVLYPREKHMLEERMHIIDMMRRINDFLDTHLT